MSEWNSDKNKEYVIKLMNKTVSKCDVDLTGSFGRRKYNGTFPIQQKQISATNCSQAVTAELARSKNCKQKEPRVIIKASVFVLVITLNKN
jgi:hypothetical protein